MTMATIASLVAKARDGDMDAFEAIVAQLQAEVRLYLAARTPDGDQIEEVLQRAFISAWEHFEQYREEGSFAGWLKTIARNHLLQDLRERGRHAAVPMDELDDLIHGACADRLRDEDEGRAIQDAERLRHCLASLGDHARTLIVRHHVEEVPLNRLAQQFRRTRAALAKVLFNARRVLRDCMLAQRATEAS